MFLILFGNVAKFRSVVTKGGSRTAATSKVELFVVIVNGFQPLIIITKRSTLDVAAVLDPSLVTSRLSWKYFASLKTVVWKLFSHLSNANYFMFLTLCYVNKSFSFRVYKTVYFSETLSCWLTIIFYVFIWLQSWKFVHGYVC